ncbi:MAG: hypothetical protein AAFX02_04945 [Pseudomonadota bacterium]
MFRAEAVDCLVACLMAVDCWLTFFTAAALPADLGNNGLYLLWRLLMRRVCTVVVAVFRGDEASAILQCGEMVHSKAQLAAMPSPSS